MVDDDVLGYLIIQQLKWLWQFCNIKVMSSIKSPVLFSAFLTGDALQSLLETRERLSLVSLVLRTGPLQSIFTQSTNHSKATTLCFPYIIRNRTARDSRPVKDLHRNHTHWSWAKQQHLPQANGAFSVLTSSPDYTHAGSGNMRQCLTHYLWCNVGAVWVSTSTQEPRENSSNAFSVT